MTETRAEEFLIWGEKQIMKWIDIERQKVNNSRLREEQRGPDSLTPPHAVADGFCT